MLHKSTARKLKELIEAVEKYGGNSRAVRSKVAPIFRDNRFNPRAIGTWLLGLNTHDDHWSTTVPLLFDSRDWNLATAMYLVESVRNSFMLHQRTDDLNPKVLLSREFGKSRDLDDQLWVLSKLIRLARIDVGRNTKIFKELFFDLLQEIRLPERKLAKKLAIWVSSNTVGCERRELEELGLIYRSVRELAINC